MPFAWEAKQKSEETQYKELYSQIEYAVNQGETHFYRSTPVYLSVIIRLAKEGYDLKVNYFNGEISGTTISWFRAQKGRIGTIIFSDESNGIHSELKFSRVLNNIPGWKMEEITDFVSYNESNSATASSLESQFDDLENEEYEDEW